MEVSRVDLDDDRNGCAPVGGREHEAAGTDREILGRRRPIQRVQRRNLVAEERNGRGADREVALAGEHLHAVLLHPDLYRAELAVERHVRR